MKQQLTDFVNYINAHEDWLMDRILDYATQRDYTKYTSTLKEAWRLSISGLSKSLVELIQQRGDDIELGPDDNYTSDPAAGFGITQAKRHRLRGITLEMFLGLMKYYRQSYQDLIKHSDFEILEKENFSGLINRYFDRVEIAFCANWLSAEEDKLISELQAQNRQMTNEKNKYLTIYESLSIPVFIVSPDGIIENMNHAASVVINRNSVPGAKYYTENSEERFFTQEFSWLAASYDDFIKSKQRKSRSEKFLDVQEQYFHTSFCRSLDISGKFTGTIIIIEDITKREKMEKELEKLALTDPLTGANNRRSFLQFFEKELTRSQRYKHPLALFMMDIDHFKAVNDKYGHDIGDRLLKQLVAETQDCLRESDMLVRWGGEEFIILLPETDINQAAKVAERLRTDLAQMEIRAGKDSDLSPKK